MATTETIRPRYNGFDSWPDEAILAALSDGQERAIAAGRAAYPPIAAAARAIAERRGPAHHRRRRRIVRVDCRPRRHRAWRNLRLARRSCGLLLANGTTLTPSLAGGPEDAERGARRDGPHNPTEANAVIAITASGKTLFTLSAAATALSGRCPDGRPLQQPRGSVTPSGGRVDLLDSSPEIVTGSTRVGAGTAQNAELGILSRRATIRLGRVYGLMSACASTTSKLRQRATVMHISVCRDAGRSKTGSAHRQWRRSGTGTAAACGRRAESPQRVIALPRGVRCEDAGGRSADRLKQENPK